MRRRSVRVLYALLLAGLFWIAVPSGASALPFGVCDPEAPSPDAPGYGITSFLMDSDPQPTPASGAWDEKRDVPRFDNYGMAGMSFSNYDLGCATAVTDPMAVVGTAVGNWMMEAPKALVSLTGGVLDAANNPTYLTSFDPMITEGVEALREAIFEPWILVSLLIVGGLLLWQSRHAQWSKATTAVAWALLVMVAASVIFMYPVKAGHVADGAVSETLHGINAKLNGQTVADDPAKATTATLSETVLYRNWKLGTFGAANSATADKYAKRVFQSRTLTYDEQALVNKDPDGEGKALLERKADDFEKVAEEIKKSDPAAYQYFTGLRNEIRVWAPVVALYTALCTLPFPLFSAAMLIGMYLIIRFAVIFFPMFAVVGAVYSARGAVTAVGMVVAAAVLNTLMFGVAGALALFFINRILYSDVATWLAMLLMLMVTIILWVATKPMRKLTAMADPSKSFKAGAGAGGSMLDSAKSTAWDMTKAGLGAAAALKLAGVGGDKDTTETAEAKADDGEGLSEDFTREEQEVIIPTATPRPPDPAPVGTTEITTGTYTVEGEVIDHETRLPEPADPVMREQARETAEEYAYQQGTWNPASEAPTFESEPIPVTEPEIDVETGDEVWKVFRPDEADDLADSDR